MLYAILGLVDPGDEVLVPDPGYPIYESLTRFVGATPVPIPIRTPAVRPGTSECLTSCDGTQPGPGRVAAPCMCLQAAGAGSGACVRAIPAIR